MARLKRTGAPAHSRTDAQTPQSTGGSEPQTRGNADHGFMRQGVGAETADRMDREAWGVVYRSAYTHHIQLPDGVEAGDYDTAHQILFRIQRQVEKGGWTTNEWNRLHQMEEAWGRRASGQDLQFNMRGWQKKHPGHNLPPFERAARQIAEAVEDSRQGRGDHNG